MKLLLPFLFLASSAFAQDGFDVLKEIGKVYQKTDNGKCAPYLDIMRWGVAVEEGLVSFALTGTPNVRPLSGYSLNATMSAKGLRPLGSGEFLKYSNQPVPLKAEYDFTADGNLSLYVHHKGKGSMGSIFFPEYHGYPKENHKFQYDFSEKNAEGIFEKVKVTYHDLKGLFPKRKVVCNFKIVK